MPKSAPMINNFSGGELTPRLDARTDLQKYFTGCTILENMIPFIEGGATARPGTYFVTETKNSAKCSRLFAFQFSTVQAYIIEAGEYYFRFYKDSGQIVVAYAAWGTGTAYALGALVTNSGTHYRCLIAHTSGTFATDLAAGKWVATAGATDLAYEIPSPYTEAQVKELKITQSADILYIAHRSHNIRKLSRTAHTTWTLTNFVAAIDVAMTITGATKANPCVVTATLGAGGSFPEAGDSVYIASVAGMTELNDSFFVVAAPNSGAGTFQLSGINSTAYTEYSSGGTATRVQFGTSDNNPGAIAFYEQRFMAGGTNNNPLDIFGSASSDFENFIQDSKDSSSALQYSLLSDKVDGVRWMIGEEYLMIGTQGGVWRLGSSSTTEGLAMDNVSAKRQSSGGVMDMDAEMVQSSVIYVQRGGMTVRKMEWDYATDKYATLDVNRISKHITKGATRALSGIVDMDCQSEPIPILWAVRADGQLLGMSYEPAENIMAWFRLITVGAFESVACISADSDEDQVWEIANRTIGEATKRYVEYFKPQEFFAVFENAFFVDSGLTWDGGATVDITGITQADPAVVSAAGHTFTDGMKVRITGVEGMTEVNLGLTQAYTVANAVSEVSFELDGIDSTEWTEYDSGGTAQQVANTVTGLSHLEGETVSILTNYGAAPAAEVASGAITLTYYANVITAGLPYTYNLKPMKIEPGASDGSSKGKKKRIYRLAVSFFETYGAKWGYDVDSLVDVPFGSGGTPSLFTGDKETDFDMDYETGATVHIQGCSPLPMTVLSIAPSMVGE